MYLISEDKEIESQLTDSHVCVACAWHAKRESWIFRPKIVTRVVVIVDVTHNKKCPSLLVPRQQPCWQTTLLSLRR